MSLHKIVYSSEQLKLKEYQDFKKIMKYQEKLSQILHSKLNDFQNKIENRFKNREKSNRRKNKSKTLRCRSYSKQIIEFKTN